jgi:exopolysaccharide biosynthesis polyprenyl glycosylphosphotransferase
MRNTVNKLTAVTSSPKKSPQYVGDLLRGQELGAAAEGRLGPTGVRSSVLAPVALVFLAVDSVLLIAACIANDLGARPSNVSRLPLAWEVAFCFAVLAAFGLMGLYRNQFRPRPLDDLRSVIGGVGFICILLLAGRGLGLMSTAVAPVQALRLFVFALAYVGAGRLFLSRWQMMIRREGNEQAATLFVGTGKSVRLMAERLSATPEIALDPVGYVGWAGEDDLSVNSPELPFLGTTADLESVLGEHRIERLVFGPSSGLPEDDIVHLVDRCDEVGVSVAFIPQLTERTTRSLSVEHVGGVPLIFLAPTNPSDWRLRVKYGIDRMVAGALLLLAAPLFLLAAVAIWKSPGRGIFFRQRRVGVDGREFELLKFRTMTDSERTDNCFLPTSADGNSDVAPGGIEGRDRRTPIGTLLRRTSIDELPQLINVLRGDMSLIGPRPERSDLIPMLSESVHRYNKRLRMKSGITGLAQINGLRGKTSLSDRVELDNHYIENWSFWLDFKIVALTLPAVVTAFSVVE